MSIFRYLKLRNAPHGSFAANVLTLMSGTTIAQAIPIAISPILTRLYDSQDFGVFALYVSISAVFGVVATGRYELAVMLPKRDEDAACVTMISCMAALGISLALLLFILMMKSQIIAMLGNPAISQWLYFIPLSVLLSGVYQSLNYWLNRHKFYKQLALGGVSQAAVTSGANLFMGINTASAGSLITGNVIGQFVAVSVLAINAWKTLVSSVRFVHIGLIREKIKKYRHFPLYSAPACMLDIFSCQAPVFVLNKFYDAQTAGFFSLTTKMVSIPGVLIGGSIAQVYYQRITQSVVDGTDTKGEVKKLASRLALMATLPTIFLILFSPDFFAIVFSEKWRVSGEFARILALAYAVRFIVSPLSLVLPATGNVKLGSMWQVLYFITTVTSLGIALRYPVDVFICVYVIHEIILYSVYYLMIMKATNKGKGIATP